MQLTITTSDDQILNLDVSEELEVENLKAQCQFELSIPSANFVLFCNGKQLTNEKLSLKQHGVTNGDVLLLQTRSLPELDFGSIAIPGASGVSRSPRLPNPQLPGGIDPRQLRRLIENSPHERALLKERNPPLSAALESGDEEQFVAIFNKQQKEKLDKERERMRLLQMDPFDPRAQELIAEEIRLKNVESNMETAIEHVPESFGQVHMLYIDCEVNGHPVKAFVDSGAQMTIMSQKCAERCGIMRLVDRRWAGIAKGVGTQKIIGRVHLVDIQIKNDFLNSSFSILEQQPMDMLLGLDMLKRHQCLIDLKNNELVIGTTGTRTAFLHENELPAHARINQTGQEGLDMETEDGDLAKLLQQSAEEAAGGQNTNTAAKSSALKNTDSSAASNNSGHSSAGSSSSVGGASGAQRTFPEATVKRLVEKGYSRNDVLEALTACDGQEERALMALLAKSLRF